MKKVLSFILAMALVISLVPTVAFAESEQEPFYFGAGGATSGKIGVSGLPDTDRIDYIPEDGTQKTSNSTQVRANGIVQIHTKTGTWLTATAADLQQVVFTVDLGEDPATGWYQIAFTGANVEHASDLYIYAGNDNKYVYVGEYISEKTSESFAVGRTDTFGAVYLTPDSEGKVRFIVAPSKLADGETNGYILLYSLSLTYLGSNEEYGYTVKHTIPETIDCEADADGVEFTAYADAGDGIPRAMNGINSDKTTTNADSFNIEILEGDSVTLDKTITDGIASGKLVPVHAGDTTIKFTAVINGETYTDTKTVTVTETTAEDTDESVAAPTDVSYIVRGSDEAFDAGIDMTGYTAGNVGSHPINTSFTAKALEEITVGGKTYNFAYWQTAGGAPIEDAGESYTFTPKSNFTLEAVYVPAEPTDADKKVQFWNYNRVFLGEETVTDGKVSAMPTQPTLAGHTFTGWAAENIGAFDSSTEITAALTRVVAQFTADANKYSVKVDGVQEGTYAYGAPFSKTADATKETQVFSHWVIGDKVVSYDRTISFCVWNNVELTAVYADTAPTAVPTVVLDKVSADEYFILFEVPTGYTAIDAGIVFGTAGTTPRVDSTDGSKASAAKLTGQFTAAPGDSTHTAARGYVMYKVDATGEIRVIYSK